MRRPRLVSLIGLSSLVFAAGLICDVVSGGLAATWAEQGDGKAARSPGSDDPPSFGENPTAGATMPSDSDSKSGCLTDPAVLEELRSERESIADQKKQLAAKEDELKAREQALSDEMKKLSAIRDEITKTDALRKAENQEKVSKVIETLETMSPKASAKMLAELDDALAVEAISRMDTAKLAKVMNLLEPKRASELTEMLAGVARTRPASSRSTVAASEYKPTERDGARNPSPKGGEDENGQINDNPISKSNDRMARSDGTDRQPGSADKANPPKASQQ